MSSKYYVINTENSEIWNPITFHNMFESCLRIDGDVWEVCNLASGECLPVDVKNCKGIVITGSHYNCRDRDALPWFEKLCDLIRYSATVGSPKIYGGCFGCQIIAHALGGEVDYNPEKQFALKAEIIKLNRDTLQAFLKCCSDNDDNCCCSPSSCECLNMIVSHGECVVKLPPDTDLVASSPSCAHEIFITGRHKNIIGCQSHPEFQDVKYAIHDRIAPVVITERKRLTDEQAAETMLSLEKYTGEDSRYFMNLVSQFLHK